MAQVFAIANQKGGVGKTTTAINLSASLAATQRRVLVVDLDPQGNTTTGSGVDKQCLSSSVCNVLTDEQPCANAILSVAQAGYDLLPANADLTAAEVLLLKAQSQRSEFRLCNAFREIDQYYDYILIDCPPSLNMLTVNALSAATGVIIPMQCEYYALEGLSALLDSIEHIRSLLNKELRIAGILRTMFDRRVGLVMDISAQLEKHFTHQVYSTVIPRNIRLAEAPSHGLPAMYYDKKAQGALAYLALAGEVNRRTGIPPAQQPNKQQAAVAQV